MANRDLIIDHRPKKEGKIKHSLNSVRRYFSVPANVLLVIFAAVLLVFTIYPLVSLVQSTFTVSISEIVFGLIPGSFTTAWWNRVFASTRSKTYFWKPLLNSLEMSLLASVIAILYGGIVAFLITRTDIKAKKFLSSIFVFPYIRPSWTLATFWQNFFQNPDIGTGVGGMLYNLFHISVPSGMVYGIVPCAVVLGRHYAPFAYILIGGILRNRDANLEEAATILKASRWKITRKITLPIVMPSIISTFLLVFSSSRSAYAVPQYLGGGQYVLTTYRKQFTNKGFYGQAYIFAIVRIVLGVGILLLNQWFTGKRKNFTTVTGKSGQVSYIKLRGWNYPVAVILVFLSLFCSVLPLITFALESLCVRSGDYSSRTLQYWISRTETDAGNGLVGILFEPQVWLAFRNSILLSVSCCLIAGTLGILIGYAVAKRRGTFLYSLVDNLAFLPYLRPSMALGAAFLSIGTTLGIQNSIVLLILVGAFKYLPFASRSGISARRQLSGEIEESAVIQNIPWWKRMLRIIVPIQKSTVISGYLLPFTSCRRELSLFVLLASGQTVLRTTLLDSWMQWWPQSANALNLLIILTVLLFNLIVNKLTGASIDKGVGGN